MSDEVKTAVDELKAKLKASDPLALKAAAARRAKEAGIDEPAATPTAAKPVDNAAFFKQAAAKTPQQKTSAAAKLAELLKKRDAERDADQQAFSDEWNKDEPPAK